MTLQELEVALSAARERLSRLKTKHPSLKAYLVVARLGGQVEIGEGTRKRIERFPGMFADCSELREILQLLSSLEDATTKAQKFGYRRALAKLGDRTDEAEKAAEEKAKQLARAAQYDERLDELIPKLRVDDRVQVELRFATLEFELVWMLQQDSLVDRNLTPQGRGAIRVVLGTLKDLFEQGGAASGPAVSEAHQ